MSTRSRTRRRRTEVGRPSRPQVPQQPQLRPITASTLRWLRGGSVFLEDNAIYMHCGPATAYAPLADRTIGLELSRVKATDDALEFAHRFGLLETNPGVAAAGTDTQAHEPASAFTQAAADLRLLIATVRDIRRAAAGDREEALFRLRLQFGMGADPKTRAASIPAPLFGTRRSGKSEDAWAQLRARHRKDLDGHEALLWADAWVALTLQHIQAGTSSAYSRALVGEAVRPGRYRLGAAPTTLLHACTLSVAFLIAEEVTLDLCAECDGAFLPVDARQRFCTPACASRARFRRFTMRQQTTRQQTAKETRRDTAKRTRRR